MINAAINAGFLAGRLREKAEGLPVLAIVGYTPIRDDEEGTGRAVAHWRCGIIKEFQPDIFAPEIVFQFEWQDPEGAAEMGIFSDEEIIVLFSAETVELTKRLG